MKISGILLLLLCLSFAACNDEGNIQDLFPEEFHKILYIKDGGEKEITLYNTGENTTYSFVICKAGSDPSLTAHVEVGLLSQNIIDQEYTANEGIPYQIIPQDSYELDVTELSFLSMETSKQVNITLYTEKLQQVFENTVDNTRWLLPLEVTSDNDSINSDMSRYILLIEDVIEPPVGFKRAGVEMFTHDFTSGSFTTTVPFGLLTVDNLWDIEATLAVDNNFVTEYNAQHSTAYQLPANGTFKVDERVSLAANEQESSVNITISDFQGQKSGYFMLPVRIESVSMFKTVESNDIYVPAIRLVGKKWDRSEWTVVDVCTEEPTGEGANGGHAMHALDGNLSTYWHTMWSGQPQCSLPHHLVIDTKQEREFTQVGLVQRVNGSWLGDIKNFTVFVSNDMQNWVEVGSGIADKYTAEEQIFDLVPTRGRYLKFVFADTWREYETHISLVELYAYGAD